MPRILIVIEKKTKQRNSFLLCVCVYIFQSFIEIKPQNNKLLIFGFLFFLGYSQCDREKERKRERGRASEKQNLMADDDDDYFDMNSINDLSSSSFPPGTLSTIEKTPENVNNQVDFFSTMLFSFFSHLKITYKLL